MGDSGFENICIIGIGTLGGFLTKSISELETTKKLIIVDFDKVEEKNLKNSIYTKKHINSFKTDSLTNIIQTTSDITIMPIRKKYIKDIIPECDLVIDCRDFIYDRSNDIDVRMYISSRYLIIDCRKNIKYKKHHEGIYLSSLTKTDLRNAAFNSSMLIYNGILYELIKQEMVQRLELDFLNNVFSKILKEEKPNIVQDEFLPKDLEFINLENNIDKIIEKNKTKDLTVYLGPRDNYTSLKTIRRNSITKTSDVINNLTSIFTIPTIYNYFIVCQKSNYIELIPETGAA